MALLPSEPPSLIKAMVGLVSGYRQRQQSDTRWRNDETILPSESPGVDKVKSVSV